MDAKLEELSTVGYVVIPRELTGISHEEAARIHAAQLSELDSRFPGWRAAAQPADMGKSLAGGFLGVQLLKEQLAMEFDPRIKAIFTAVFSHLRGTPYEDEVWVWLERTNVSFAEPLRGQLGQEGALPHIDDNPWAATDVDSPYDQARWEPKVRQAGLCNARPMEKDRPVQAFLALTDCAGGPHGGGMGCSRDRGFHQWLQTTPPHGRNGHWGKLTRIYPKPGGAQLAQLGKEAQQAIAARHQKALDAMQYPAYRAGDLVLWLRETLHAGPKGNDSGVHAGRMYLGGLPDNALNRDAMRRQWAKLMANQQAHGRACDRREDASDLGRLLTVEQQRRCGRPEEAAAAEVDAAATSAAAPEPDPQPTPGAMADSDVFEVSADSFGLGFKNATAVLTLRRPIDGLSLTAGAAVFAHAACQTWQLYTSGMPLDPGCSVEATGMDAGLRAVMGTQAVSLARGVR